MAVLLETSLGDLVIDLYCDKAPLATKNFLKLCKMKYYNGALCFDIQRDHLCRVMHENTPPTTIYEKIEGPSEKYFKDEMHPSLKHDRFGTISTANLGPNMNNSNFFITLSGHHIQSLDGKHTIFGVVSEGDDVLTKLNEAYVDVSNRPYTNIRILHTTVLDDPFPEPKGITYPDESPQPVFDSKGRLDATDKIELLEDKGRTEEEIMEATKEHETKTKAIVLEMLNDLPDADIKPPDNVLFVCKLNPVTQEKDLETIFSRFGSIKACDVIRDWKTGASLQYAFIEFETAAACEEAFFKMDNALIDERRIHVDFSQSVAKYWYPFKKKQLAAAGQNGGKGNEGGDRPDIELKSKLTREDDRYAMVFDEPVRASDQRRPPNPRSHHQEKHKENPRRRENSPPRKRDDHSSRRRENNSPRRREDKRDDRRRSRSPGKSHNQRVKDRDRSIDRERDTERQQLKSTRARRSRSRSRSRSQGRHRRADDRIKHNRDKDHKREHEKIKNKRKEEKPRRRKSSSSISSTSSSNTSSSGSDSS